MIAVVDSGVANLASVTSALHRLNAEARITSDPKMIQTADRVILPGVGSAAAAMARLRARNLVDTLQNLTRPVLGICLGMQLLFARSEEDGGTEGLAIIPGTAKRLPLAPDIRVPHMGWNTLKLLDAAHPLLKGVADNSFAYFVHGYAVPADAHTLASCDYGTTFAAVAGQGNFFGCQFHPERSSAVGSRILGNFLAL
jgi:glutamine amidotransferase